MKTEEVLALSVEDILDAYHENENHKTEADTRFDEINGRVTLLNARVGEVNGNVSLLNARVGAIDKGLDSRNSDLAASKTYMEGLESRLMRIQIGAPRDPHSFLGRLRWLLTGK